MPAVLQIRRLPTRTSPGPRARVLRRSGVWVAALVAAPLLGSVSSARAQAVARPLAPVPPQVDPFQTTSPVTTPGQAPDPAWQLDDRNEDLQARIAQDQRALAYATQRLSRGDADLAKQRRDLDQAEQELRAGRAAAEQGRGKFEAAKAAYDSAWRGAVAEFESGEAFRTAKAAADAGRADAATAEEASLRQLAATDAYRRAREAVASAEQRSQALNSTQPATNPDRADASQTAAEAKAHLADLQARYLNDDPRVQETRRRAEETGSAFDALRQDFSRQLPQLPAVASAQAALDAAQSTGEAGSADLGPVQVRHDALATAVRQADAALEADRATVRNLQAELNDLNGRLAQAKADADRADRAQLTAARVAARPPADYDAGPQSQAQSQAPVSVAPGPAASGYGQAPLDPYGPGPGDYAPPVAQEEQEPVVVRHYSYAYSYPPLCASPPVVVDVPRYYVTSRYYYYDRPAERDVIIRGGSGWSGGRSGAYGGSHAYDSHASRSYGGSERSGGYEVRRESRSYGGLGRGSVGRSSSVERGRGSGR